MCSDQRGPSSQQPLQHSAVCGSPVVLKKCHPTFGGWNGSIPHSGHMQPVDIFLWHLLTHCSDESVRTKSVCLSNTSNHARGWILMVSLLSSSRAALIFVQPVAFQLTLNFMRTDHLFKTWGTQV